MLISETLCLYLHITIKNNAMKKEQILQVIESEVEQMQIIYYDMVENLGSQHEVTKRQEIRLSTLLLLSQKLGL